MNAWRYYCLRFADQAQCDKVLQALGLLIEATDDDQNTILVDASQHQFVIDRIGTLYHPSGAEVTDPETGQKVPEMVASIGYHINLCANNAPLLNALRPFMVTPILPKREFRTINLVAGKRRRLGRTTGKRYAQAHMEKNPTPTIRDLYPHLSAAELLEAEDNLERYLALVLRIFERMEAAETHPQAGPLTQNNGTLACHSQG